MVCILINYQLLKQEHHFSDRLTLRGIIVEDLEWLKYFRARMMHHPSNLELIQVLILMALPEVMVSLSFFSIPSETFLIITRSKPMKYNFSMHHLLPQFARLFHCSYFCQHGVQNKRNSYDHQRLMLLQPDLNKRKMDFYDPNDNPILHSDSYFTRAKRIFVLRFDDRKRRNFA